VGRCGLDKPGSGHGQVAGFCEDGNEPSGSLKLQSNPVSLTIILSRRTLILGVS
jgi:hypothetical protein